MGNDLCIIEKLCKEQFGIDNAKPIAIKRLGGLTNKNYYVTINNQKYVVRLPGDGTEELINRREEHICTSLANDIGIDSELIYFEDRTGVKITRYIDKAETMNTALVKSPNNMRDIANLFKKLHSCNISIPVIFNVFEKIEEYEILLGKCEKNIFWEDYENIKEHVLALKGKVNSMNVEITMCHNDPLCENFVRGGDRMYLVDWEYAGMNDPMWDLADLFIEAEFSADEEEIFNKLYFGGVPNKEIKERILINKVFLDFLWSLWGLQRYSCGADLLEYANERYIRAKKNLGLINLV